MTALTAAGVPVALILLLVAAWAIDVSTGSTQVRRNVSVAGRNVGGLSEDDLPPVLNEVSDEVQRTPVELVTPKGTLASNAAELGLSLDKAATAKAALDLGRHQALPLRPFAWLGSFFTRKKADLRLTVDRAKVADTVARLSRDVRTDPIEPQVAFRDGKLVVIPGRNGEGIDPTDVSERLSSVQRVNDQAISVDVDPVPVPPRVKDEAAERLLGTAEQATAKPLLATLEGEQRPIDGAALRPLIGSTPRGEDLALTLDPAGTMKLLTDTFADVGTPPQDATIEVVDQTVQVSDGAPGTGCCDPGSVAKVAKALEDRAPSVELDLTAREPENDAATFEKLGIKELVAEFTTNHPCCAPRVTNIHRMADMVSGSVIQPGATFSLNDTVGRRTVDKGFVAAPVINGDGNFDEDVGGGVSQFSTTLFNAAFFAGLEIDEYMAHGLYISRYPYGREATLSFPSPDLKIRNNTPYGILIWPTYTDTSITIGLYSTPYIEAGQASQTQEPYDKACVRVTTVRSRTWINTGETSTDNFYALYAPDEGVQCDGTTRPKPGEETTTTTATTAPPEATTTPAAPTTQPAATPPATASTAPPSAPPSATTAAGAQAAPTTAPAKQG
jgi:vancomycin resistance protein YoaR